LGCSNALSSTTHVRVALTGYVRLLSITACHRNDPTLLSLHGCGTEGTPTTLISLLLALSTQPHTSPIVARSHIIYRYYTSLLSHKTQIDSLQLCLSKAACSKCLILVCTNLHWMQSLRSPSRGSHPLSRSTGHPRLPALGSHAALILIRSPEIKLVTTTPTPAGTLKTVYAIPLLPLFASSMLVRIGLILGFCIYHGYLPVCLEIAKAIGREVSEWYPFLNLPVEEAQRVSS